MAEAKLAAPPGNTTRPTLRRSLNVWQVVGLSIALMAPSMAANINPQGTRRRWAGRYHWHF